MPTVPTLAVEHCCDEDLEEARRRFDAEWLVIKPPVSASATGTLRLGPMTTLPDESRGRAMIIQPLIEEIATAGEFSLMLFDGEYSHAVVKHPKSGDFRVQPHLGGTTVPSPPPPGGVALARAALAAAPARAAYARVDMVPDASGDLMIMELELIEPALFLDSAPDGGAAFAQSILALPSARSNSHWRIADVRFGTRSALEPLRVDLRDQRIDRAAPLARGGFEGAPEHRLEADRGLMAGDQHRAFLSAARSRPCHQYICWPPLIDSVEPVMKPAFSSTRNATPRAISSALPRRLTGIRATILPSTSSGTAATISVSI